MPKKTGLRTGAESAQRSGGVHPVRLGVLCVGLLLAASLLTWVQLAPGKPEISATAGLAVLMATLWITEAIPLAATSLLPMVILPLFGVMPSQQVAANYFSDIIFLYIGGFLIALAMQRWGLHRRIALRTLLSFGSNPRMLMLGFMLVSAVLSMWISNTATTMMMMTVVTAVLATMDLDTAAAQPGQQAAAERARKNFSGALLLATAYAATIGGISTLVGTPPNLSFVAILNRTFPDAPAISFSTWLVAVGPISILMFGGTWGVLNLMHVRPRLLPRLSTEVLRAEHRRLGKMRIAERVVGVAFFAVAVLWVTRTGIAIGDWELPGWSQWLVSGELIRDGSVAIAVAVVLFMVPVPDQEAAGGVEGQSSPSNAPGRVPGGATGIDNETGADNDTHESQAQKGQTSEPARPWVRVLDWETASQLPWNIIMLFGGGFALAGGFKESGLTLWIGQQLEGLSGVNPILLIAFCCLAITLLTELTSNLATTEMLLPVIAGLAIAVGVHPLLLMVPVTISCSCAFMMPVATPPNAIVFGTGRVSMEQMIRSGMVLNLLGVTVIVCSAIWWLPTAIGFDPTELPDWCSKR